MIPVAAAIAIGLGTSVVGAYVVRYFERRRGVRPTIRILQRAAPKMRLKLDIDAITALELRRTDLTPEQRAFWLAKTAENPAFGPGGKYEDTPMSGVDERLERLRRSVG